MNEAEVFLTELWRHKPDSTAVQMWRKSDHKTFTYASLDPVVHWIEGNGDTDVYMAAGLAAREQSAPSRKRATKQQVVGIPGVWADIDINGGPEGKTGAARNLDEALSLAEAVLRPTLLVNSGYGLQAWWLFDDGVWTFHTEAERDEAQKVVAGFQGALRAQAKKHGFNIDSTFDLARLMRVPGSFNHKGPEAAPVELLDDGGPRYRQEEVSAVGAEFQNNRRSTISLLTGEGVEIEIRNGAQPPLMKLQQLFEVDEDFKHNWNHVTTSRNKLWSMSEYEFSFVNIFYAAGWSDQEICDALVFHRLYHEPGDPKGKNRAERIAQTIGKVRATRQHEEDKVTDEQEREAAVEELAAIGGEAGLDPVRTLGIFNRVLGGPEVKELIQYGRDPDTCRYVLALANGDEVPLNPEQLFNLERFRDRFAIVTRFRPKRIKGDKWDEIVQALLSAAHVKEDAEDTRSHRAMEWVRAYTERRTSSDRDAACQANDPFTQGGNLYVPLGPFHQYLRKIQGERIADVDLRQYLESAGFERRTINYTKDDGKRSTRSYFVLPAASL